jgi:hypothetical protein
VAAYEVLLLNTAVPQIQAAQSGDTYVVPRDIAFSTVASFAAGTALLPSIARAGDLNTGFWFPAADTIAASTGGSEQMRLTSTGLGIGTSSPTAKLTVDGGAHIRGYTAPNTSFQSIVLGITGGEAFLQPYTAGLSQIPLNIEGSTIKLNTGGTTTATLDSSGNLGLGVTPSAWRSTTKALQSTAGAIYDFSATGKGITQNAFLKEAPDAWTYVNSGPATQYDTGSGAHTWYTAPSGTAGNAITFTQALTLDANRNLLLNGTTAGASSVGTFAIFNGTAPTGSVTDGVILYAEDVSTSSELKVRDEAGNVTTLSPHNFELIPEGPSEDMAWSYYSERDGKRINVDMLKAIRLLEKLSGEKLVHFA